MLFLLNKIQQKCSQLILFCKKWCVAKYKTLWNTIKGSKKRFIISPKMRGIKIIFFWWNWTSLWHLILPINLATVFLAVVWQRMKIKLEQKFGFGHKINDLPQNFIFYISFFIITFKQGSATFPLGFKKPRRQPLVLHKTPNKPYPQP